MGLLSPQHSVLYLGVLRRVVPVERLRVDELLVLGWVVDREGVFSPFEAVLHDQRLRQLAQDADHRQLLGPHVEDLLEQLVALGLIRLSGELIPSAPDLADVVIRRRLLGVGIFWIESPEAPRIAPWSIDGGAQEDQRRAERQQRAVAAPEGGLNLVGV